MNAGPFLPALAAALSVAAGGACAGPPREPAMSPPRPAAAPLNQGGDITIRQEYEAARRARSVAALELFIARHPTHPLVPAARQEQAALLRNQAAGSR